ncbi:MAG: oligosaccharide flippase family protein [Candidatus Peribacteraceae bacterium]|nr:oligosaccharide flippase family protein [Candidatus Peribacteraceae bacterium]
MSTRQIASSTLWQLASQIVMAALSIVTVKLVAIGLSIELAGNYNTAYGYLQIFGILADFGLYAVSVREVARAKDKAAMLGNLMTLRAIILALSLGSALIIAFVIPHWRGTPLPLAIAIAAFVPTFTLLAGILRTVFQVEYKLHYVFIAEVTHRIVSVSLTALAVWWSFRNSSDVRALYVLLACGGAGSVTLFFLSAFFSNRLLRVRPRWDPEVMKRLLRLCAPYGIAFLCTSLYRQFDVTLIGLLRPQDYELQNAYYGFVQRMMDMAYLLPTFLLNSTLPVLSERDANKENTRDLLGTILFAILLVGSVSLLFSALWPRPLMQMLTTEQYLSTATSPGADTALRLLSVSMFMNGLLTFSFYILLTKHRWRPLVSTLLVGVVLSLASNLFLIPDWGFVGAAMTSIVVHTTLALLLLPQALRTMPARVSTKLVVQWAGFSLLLLGFLWLTRPFLDSPMITAMMLVAATAWMAASAGILGIHKTLRL